ncbi:hypothetical protein P175DRAFT_0554630 [Aspergillus ochraceoroseus IBT 24754]|uniref:Uncharacterized protein n=1 Tax=Aspergillus ochraceoroseus IBT 24754 TaxID=1392256 RepID=A0A2T5MA32_9EURO|nr:uncharacterized protein P175DRAFT_0554630 [Aspergillus ochraceoroseus IBT 24754]PTU25391.1 hypothetical protein P175DRAFT_0554630 [Aspergillus ochraceoroseus IBT 24754]
MCVDFPHLLKFSRIHYHESYWLRARISQLAVSSSSSLHQTLQTVTHDPTYMPIRGHSMQNMPCSQSRQTLELTPEVLAAIISRITEIESVLQRDPVDWAEEAETPQEDEGRDTAELFDQEDEDEDEDEDEEATEIGDSDSGEDSIGIMESEGGGGGGGAPPEETNPQRTHQLAEPTQEFHSRQQIVDGVDGEKVHHFNWFGKPVYRNSSTPPEVSLWFILAKPKAPQGRDKLRVKSVLKRARVWVDPVLVSLERGARDLHRGSAYDLIRFAEKRTFKFYTPHGTWQLDRDALQGGALLDQGTAKIYHDDKWGAGGGFMRSRNIRPASDWYRERSRIYGGAPRRSFRLAVLGARRRKEHGYGRRQSALRLSMTAEDL